ncbi:TM0106 family RecB-like putative nuclease [Chryseolinea lacunae]|uniref:TM0106 family RecB-like putative nuclease n=1 Tax=Chryseolinea lacunae TaxID=2801331 RepID=A0ABS1KUM8_9BACT|nr:TM0106 family RecB-like putative nuclease [Chryseolinea lacunae]MBL0743174.1 TM0106 family RecB-like putative nuclease [Chryseolinea lacunae]
MRIHSGTLYLAATDLSNYLGCMHLSQLDLAVAKKEMEKPDWFDPALAILAQRGEQHELAYVEHLKQKGLQVVNLKNKPVADTLDAMARGEDVIVQATLSDGQWTGNADILMKVPGTSRFGNWRYEVQDTKLSQHTRAGTILQLCLYTDLLGRLQESTPWQMYVVKPGNNFEPEKFLYTDFRAYYTLIRKSFEHFMSNPARTIYPNPVEHCQVCRWWKHCDARRHADDHLSLVAGIRTAHREELERQHIGTLAQYATEPDALREKPQRGNRDSYASLHEQAKIQFESRIKNKLVYKLLAPEPGRGFFRLPAPDNGDIYFDIEGDPFFDTTGLEYLLGFSYRDENGALVYRALHGHDAAAEKKIFEQFIDFVMARWQRHPNAYIYHYGLYEPGAVKRLAGRHSTRTDEVDSLLRAERFIDLHLVIRESLKAGVEHYSLKDLEQFTPYERQIPLPEAGTARRALERFLELREVDTLPPEILQRVETYNEDDCRATAALHTWVEERRTELINTGAMLTRPENKTGEASDNVKDQQTRALALFKGLTAKLPADRETWTPVDKGKWLLAHLVDYFRREDKSAWWEYFRVHELGHDALLEERKAITGLDYIGPVLLMSGKAKIPVHRYSYPPQEVAFDVDDELHEVKGAKVGSVHAIDLTDYTIDIKKTGKTIDIHPYAVHVLERIDPSTLANSLMDLANDIIEDGLDNEWPHRAAKHLLLKKKPRFLTSTEGSLLQPGEDAGEGALRLARALDKSVLAIQGPPGTGKTHTGASMIVALLGAGKKVGVTAVGHKVIRNLLEKVIAMAAEQNIVLRCVHKVTEKSETPLPGIKEVTKPEEALAALNQGTLVGGTAWLWADKKAIGTLDYLFVDEAGQMSLSQVLAATRATNNLILLGDPQQLEQPQRGAHPEGSDVAALTYLLDGHKTMPDDRGIFLGVTRRLHPNLCAFTSELFYESRLQPFAGLEHQQIKSSTPFHGGGLFFMPVLHSGCQNHSHEEVEAVANIVHQLTQTNATWVDADGEEHPLTAEDILIVAPYNAQVGALREKLSGLKIGTVDKFQGQQAPVVIYSMTSSSPEDAPRGMSFLYNPNRLNVATSRAKCICILVASPKLMEPDCRTVDQMKWANALCRYGEMATWVR